MISLILPIYNEKKILQETVKTAEDYLRTHFPCYELILADDGSTDGGCGLLAESETLRKIGYGTNRGKGYAVKTAMAAARGDYVFYTDADLAYGLEPLERAVKLLEETGADVVLGSRRLDKEGYARYPLLRKLASNGFHVLTALISGVAYDSQCGFKGFRREAGQKLFAELETERFAFDVELVLLAEAHALKLRELPVQVVNHRESKVSVLRDSLGMLWDMLKIRRSVERRFEKRGA